MVSVTRFSSDQDVLAWANDVEYGLAASVLTKDVGRALNAARVLQFGTVWINDHMPIVAEMPHGGFKQSGHGKDMSVYALEEYTEIKHVMVRLSDGEDGPTAINPAPASRIRSTRRDRLIAAGEAAGVPLRATGGVGRGDDLSQRPPAAARAQLPGHRLSSPGRRTPRRSRSC